ncbi:MAG TPA: threonylcarbamoyl-AMP synthase [Candidatus Tidjanibacter faecipullorum]|uniref:Threonylcarbamoyl-AMP synthase n=1 Tax=Candidatus Tidjanibacter faecipullorum TaxID=2838766 RepID=A0A9D2DDH7_9BACT|nr:threonylcarbamoyl-AMP synthase [Candidatus Tidjanibacter faecipullorum]
MLVKIYPENPHPREVARVVETLRHDGVVICPTDGVYAFVCALSSQKAIDRIKTLRNRRNDELTLICDSLSRVSQYARVDNGQFRLLKRNLPGAFTFVLQASGQIPVKALGRRKTVGIRVPSNAIPVALVQELDMPLVTASVKTDDEVVEYAIDPELLEEHYGHQVDLVIDGGPGGMTPTTVVDLTTGEPEILREGAGELV